MDQGFQKARPFKQAQPFRFDTVFATDPVIRFEAEEQEEVAEDVSLAVSVLRAELDALRATHAQELAEARLSAAIEAEERMRSERDNALLSAFDALHAGWEEQADMREGMLEELRSEAVALALAIGEKLAGHALATNPAEAVDQAIGRVLGLIARGQEVVIRVHPDLIADVEARIAVRQSRDRRQLNLLVEGEVSIPMGDARLRWDGGGMKVSAAERRAAIDEELASLSLRAD